MNEKTRPFLLTLGEPAGIGPDIALLAHRASPRAFSHCLIVAPASWLEQRARALGVDKRILAHTSWNAASKACLEDEGASHLHCWNPAPSLREGPIYTGTPSATTAPLVIACIREAALRCLHGEAEAMITAPIEKCVLRDNGFEFPGHTEFLATLANGEREEKEVSFAMMLASSQLRVVLLTRHVALRDVPTRLSTEDTIRTLCITHQDLRERFGIERPRLALCALNPHAGEQGHFGDEEQNILKPAIEYLNEKTGIHVHGPAPSDTLFSPQMRSRFDAIVCCYHDQGLIPIKTLSFGDAVNITLGLPFIRTSVDHGTALDRAGSGAVHHGSLLRALEQARYMSQSIRRQAQW